ncbi:MAG: hypothetical protein ACTHKT_12860 [Solirubrobacterales bacterium]
MSNGEGEMGTIETRVPARLDRLIPARVRGRVEPLESEVSAIANESSPSETGAATGS